MLIYPRRLASCKNTHCPVPKGLISLPESSAALSPFPPLHTLCRTAKYDVHVKDGIAEDEFTSWGAFVIGAEADQGKTRPELNLKNIKGGAAKFYQQ